MFCVLLLLGFKGLVFNHISAVLSNFWEENKSHGSVWHNVFQKFLDQRNRLPILYRIAASNIELKDDHDLAICTICNVVVGALLMERSFEMTNIQLSAEAQYFCTEILKLEDERVCEGVINSNIDSLGYIVDNKENVNSLKICNLLVGCNSSSTDFEWTLDVPKGSTVTKVDSTGADTFKIAHLTDIHYDPRYTAGKVLECGEPLCCQDDQQDAAPGEASCGYWTSTANSDSSFRLISATIDQMNTQDFDYVYFTGDLVAHRVWSTSPEYNSKLISDIMDLFAEKFNKPVYPILGNHETHPVNIYAPMNITDEPLTNQWLYDLVFDKWSKWLGEDVKDTIKNGGYYTVSPRAGFRIIVLNNNVCQTGNWWNLYDDYDPYGQLQWLGATLEKSEEAKEIVHILTHIPNSHCLKSWSREYNKIIERFSNTIAAQFNGHTHRDQFHIFYDSKSNPMSVVFNGGSLMADTANPNYKIYKVDSTGYDVIDSETYTFDLEEANADENHKINWYKLNSYQEQFGVTKLIPSELDGLVNGIIKDIENNNFTLIQKYHNYYFRNSSRVQNDCDETCGKQYLCEILTTVRGETGKCPK